MNKFSAKSLIKTKTYIDLSINSENLVVHIQVLVPNTTILKNVDIVLAFLTWIRYILFTTKQITHNILIRVTLSIFIEYSFLVLSLAPVDVPQ